jgi:hypothetical protein
MEGIYGRKLCKIIPMGRKLCKIILLVNGFVGLVNGLVLSLRLVFSRSCYIQVTRGFRTCGFKVAVLVSGANASTGPVAQQFFTLESTKANWGNAHGRLPYFLPFPSLPSLTFAPFCPPPFCYLFFLTLAAMNVLPISF